MVKKVGTRLTQRRNRGAKHKKANSLKALKSFKSFLDEAFGFIGYAGLNPAYKVKVKRKMPLTLILILYAGFSPAYSMEGRDLSRPSV
jgi:hypothetical protein